MRFRNFILGTLIVLVAAFAVVAYDGPQTDVSRILGGYFTNTTDRTAFTDSTGNVGSQALRITATGGLEVQGPKASGSAKLGNPVLVGGQDGTNTVTLHTDSSGDLQVDVLTSVSSGDVAHDSADSGSPVKIGGKGSAAVASAVTEGDRVNASFTLEGRLRTTGEGTIAHDAADSGNPIKVGGKGNAAAPSAATEGDRVDASFDLQGQLRTLALGDVAHDAADSGNPLKIGGIGRAVWETAASTAADRVNASFDLFGRLRTDGGGYAAADGWSIKNRAAANTAATISKAAGAAGVKHVATGFMVTFSSLGAPTPEIIGFQIRDGATGAGTVIWEGSISLPAVAGESKMIAQSGLWLVGTAATAMTIETDAGGGANDYLSVSLQGVSIK